MRCVLKAHSCSFVADLVFSLDCREVRLGNNSPEDIQSEPFMQSDTWRWDTIRQGGLCVRRDVIVLDSVVQFSAVH